ncbi:MAG: DUF2798 domain-containing protein [Anaerofustis sp.]
MINRKFFGLIMNFWFCFLIGIAMSIGMQWFNKAPMLFLPIFIAFLEAFAIGFVIGSLIPLPKIGDAFAKTLRCKERSLLYILIYNIPITLIMVVIMSFSLTLINVGFVPYLLGAWISGFPFALLLCYLVSVLITPVIPLLANAIVKKA